MRETKNGSTFPLGASTPSIPEWWNFAVYSPHTITSLVLGDYTTGEIIEELPLDPIGNRTGDIWHIGVKAFEEKILWGWRVHAPHIQKKHAASIAVDPYATFLRTGNHWGKNAWDSLLSPGQDVLISAASRNTFFPWKEKNHKSLKPKNLIIYEAHVRGFTHDPSSKSLYPGTFLAMADKISHLKNLGVTALELMPIYEFNENDWHKENPIDKSRLCNYWGYSPLNFFSLMGRYGTSPDPIQTAIEFKELVETCHDNEIAVILDVVYNHTGEGNNHGPAYSFKMLAEETYYIKKHGHFENISGCGNTLNSNHPVVISLIIDSLRHAVLEYHVDGFRFDLASVMTRDQHGIPMTQPSLVEAIIRDPILKKCILITEPWDAAGLYQTGNLYQLNQVHLPLFQEWNDKYRDDVRKFFKGTLHSAGNFATRLAGSQDLYGLVGSPKNSINYITAHDGFSLYDLVSYNHKHNAANGEHNRDGMNENHSWNCGHEGETKKKSVLSLRNRQIKNMLTALLLSQGNPMILMGDECKATKNGNNNAWCQDSPLSWLNWNDLEKDSLTRFISTLIELRIRSKCFEKASFLTPADIDWHGVSLFQPKWESGFISFSLKNKKDIPIIFAGFNASSVKREVEIPLIQEKWRMVCDSAKNYPKDCFALGTGPLLKNEKITVHSFSSFVFANILLDKDT